MNLEGHRDIQVEFRQSLLQSIVLDLTFVSLANEYEGFDQWVYSAHAAMSVDLKKDIDQLLTSSFGNKLLLHLAHTAAPQIDTIPGIIRYVNSLEDQWINESNTSTLRKLAGFAGQDTSFITKALLQDRSALTKLLFLLQESEAMPIVDTDSLVEALQQPEEMKAQIVYVLTRFWDRHAEEEFKRCRLLEERSIKHYENEMLVGSVEEIFTAVTGREYPNEHVPSTEQAETLVFVPSCHCGPYVSVLDIHSDGRVLVITYNCRPSAGGSDRSVVPVEEIFPPLKALADESRLEILSILTEGEFYAQQIVDRMGISQSAVSRHLRLLVAGGVLRERKHEGMKFYRINDDSLSELTRQLDTLRSRGE